MRQFLGMNPPILPEWVALPIFSSTSAFLGVTGAQEGMWNRTFCSHFEWFPYTPAWLIAKIYVKQMFVHNKILAVNFGANKSVLEPPDFPLE